MTTVASNIDLFTSFSQRRPSFKVGVKFEPELQPIKPRFPPRRRIPTFDGRLRRINFQATAPQPRGLKTIEEIERLKIKQEGIKVRLGPGSLGEIDIPVLDSRGRPTFDSSGKAITRKAPFNFAALQGFLGQNLSAQLQTIENLVASGTHRSARGINQLGAMVARLVGELDRMDPSQTREIQKAVALLPILSDPQIEVPEAIQGRFVDNGLWNSVVQNRIKLFLLKNAARPLSFAKPVFGVGGGPITMGVIAKTLAAGGVLDLQTQRLFRSVDEAMKFIRVRSTSEVEEKEGRDILDDPEFAGRPAAAPPRPRRAPSRPLRPLRPPPPGP